jgi:hypothetical protein
MTSVAVHTDSDPVRHALSLRDPFGVLSVYVGARDAAIPGNAPMHALLVELDRVHGLVDGSSTTDRGRARAALAVVEQHVRWATLHDETRDLAIFAAPARGEVQVFQPGSRVPTRAGFGPRADVRPLCQALDAARPEGLAVFSREGLALYEWRAGALAEIWSERAPELEEHPLVGPAHAHPRGRPDTAPGFSVAQQRDLYERRMRDEMRRFLVEAGHTVAELAREHEWRTLALAGDNRLTSALARGIPSSTHVELTLVARLERWRGPGELASLVAPTFDNARERRTVNLVRQVLEGSDGRAALGLRETLAALQDARVETLLVAGDRAIAGRSSPSGLLAAPGDVPYGATEEELTDEPMLADSMIDRALATGASVVVLTEGPAQVLGDDVAAVLRY